MDIQVKIEGVSPLLCNRFTDEQALAATAGKRSTKKTDSRSPHEQCESKLYVSDDGVIGIPTMNILAAIRDGGRFFKAGKRQLTTGESSMIPAFVIPQEIFVPLVHVHPWRVDSRAVCNATTKGRRLCYRPTFEDWSLTFNLDFCDDEFDVSLLREVIDCAGKRVGIGDYRPARKGPFGRFVVTSWIVKKVSLAA